MKINEKTLLQLEKQEQSLHAKKWIVTIAAILLCFIDQAKGSAYGGVHMVAVNLTGFAIAAMILIHYHIRDFMKPAHFAWPIVFLLAFLRFTDLDALETVYEKGQWITAALNIWLFGHIAIAVFYHYFSRRKVPAVRWFFFGLWIFMMSGMIFSRYDSLWPFWFFCMFGCFYLTKFTKEEMECLFDGLLNGIIISFFLIQGFGTFFRMFEVVRYTGMYTNSNINALFYLMVQCAVLGKWYRFEILGKSIGFRVSACIGNGILIAYCALTIGRTALAVMLLNTVLLLFLLLFVDKKYRLSKISLRIAGVALAAIYSFPVVFASARYVPVHFASPLLLGTQYTARNTIDNFSAEDKRFVSMDNFIKYFLGRFDELTDPELLDQLKSSRHNFNPFLPVMIAKAASEVEPTDSPEPMGSGTSKEDPLYSDASQINKFNIRVDIYKGYLMRLNLAGHEKKEADLWITKRHHFGHCHNFLLQMLFNFGWIPGILFGCTALIAILYYFVRCILYRDANRQFFFCSLLLITSFAGFGMMELDWELGQMPFTLFFAACYLLFQKDKKRNMEPTA